MIKLIVAGGRDFNDYPLLKKTLDFYLQNHDKGVIEIVSGGARGADRLGEKYANENGITIKQFIPDWDGLSKRAGFVRNAEMGDYSTHLIAFWNGSNGTKNMIDYARKKGLVVVVVDYPKVSEIQLPINYKNSHWTIRKQAREQYCVEQAGLCHYCGESLDGEPRDDIKRKVINVKLFPKGMFDHPVHLHHCHKTHMTIGAVHARCNAVLWQYHGE